jgi:glyoxylase-like metal-dependent hydrolase (beta-lactamase superfamily II)
MPVRAWSPAPLHTAVYTHGHVDHAFGLGPFLEAGERPHVVAQEACVQRFHRYRLTHGLNNHINRRQFGNPAITFPQQFVWPTLTFRESLVQHLGDLEVQYHAARGETDDHCFVWVPARGYLFTGDLIIWVAPNCGNPQKVQRYPAEWADALERMAALDAEWLFPGHGYVVQGREAVRAVLTDTARYLRVIVEQVLARMNAGETPEVIFHGVEPDPVLAPAPISAPATTIPSSSCATSCASGADGGTAMQANLLPATWEAQAREIAALAGGVEAVVARGRRLLEAGDAVLAAHLAEWATRAAPEDVPAQRLKRDVYARRLAEAEALMAQGIFRAAMNDARTALGEPPLRPLGAAAL